MKVVVRCAHNRITKADMEREIERLFQENKDLRVYIGHLHDELSLAQQKSEARRQVICERDKLIQELNDQIEAGEQALNDMNFDLCDKVNDQEKMSDKIADLRGELCVAKRKIAELESRLAEVCAQRDNYESSYKQVCEWWGNEQTKARKEAERAEEYRIALMESDCRVDELERRVEWLQDKNDEWAQVAVTHKNTIAAQKKEKEALEDVIHAFEETRKEYEEEIHAQHVEKREWMQKYEELKAQKEADDKKCEETCAACNERYEDVLAERNHLRSEVVRLTTERNTSVSENSELIFSINELQDKWEAEHNLRAEAEKAYDKVASEAYDMHQQITNLTIDNTRLENRMNELMKEHNELEADYDALAQTKREYAEEIDRLRKVVTNLQSTRFTIDEFIRMIAREFMPSTGKGFADSVDF